MLSLAILRVSKPYGRCSGIACRPIVAHICPQPAGLGLAVARSEYRNRDIVGVDLRCLENVPPDLVDQRSK